MHDKIIIKGARENNLKNISLEIPKNKLVVLTGLSGSGKSTLAFDTLQRECQRLYMESLGMSTDLLPKAKVDRIEGLSPSISIHQYNGNMNPRSTVGTLTDILTFLRILFSRIGERPCPKCGKLISQDNINMDAEKKNTVINCLNCKENMPPLTKRDFSFNTPEGACPVCKGLGVTNEPNIDLLIDNNKSIRNGGILSWDEVYINRYGKSMINAGKHYGFEFDIDIPIKEYSDIQMMLLLYGVDSPQFSNLFPTIKTPKTVLDGKFEGVVTNLMRRYAESQNGTEKLGKLLISKLCPICKGSKLREESLKVTINNKNIIELSDFTFENLSLWLKQLPVLLSQESFEVAAPILDMIQDKLSRLIEIEVGYLSLNRTAISLSAGEMQRLRLASLLGTGLTGVLYVLDEPTTGLHPSDNSKLIGILKKLRDMGNTVLVVEHDPEFIEAADYMIDIGPGAGKNGGRVIATGTPEQIAKIPQSVTGKYLFLPPERAYNYPREGNGKSILIHNASVHNLKDVNVKIPLGKLVALTGVSGSGKSTLMFDVLYEYAQNEAKNIFQCQNITGLREFQEILVIDQSPIGRSSRSNAATYTDIYSHIRSLFADLPEAKQKGLKAKDFSFNVAGGRCEKCEGVGILNIPMHFMPDVQATCPVCKGERFQKHILEVTYKGYSISDVLNMSIDDAFSVFVDNKLAADRLAILKQVGLGYLTLGQPASTLSGGEAQRIKLARELGKATNGHTLYLLDEPTTGLHPQDVNKLITLLNRMVDQGHSVIVIEHNMDFIQSVDWIIDFGPKGGTLGGQVVATGTPEEIMCTINSITGQCLKKT